MRKIMFTVLIILLISSSQVMAKKDKPILWEEVFAEKGITYCVDINHIIHDSYTSCYLFIMRTYSVKKGYQIYSCYYYKTFDDLSWSLRWEGTEYPNKRSALPVEPQYFHCNTKGNKIMGERLPLTDWQISVTKFVVDEVMLYPENTTFIDSTDDAPLLPEYPYANGRRR